MSIISNLITGKRRIIIVVNKWWECDPVMAVLTNDNVRPYKEIGWPEFLRYPCSHHHYSNEPRAIFNLTNIEVEIWCISDLLGKFEDKPCFQSSSERKMEVLPSIYSYKNQTADLVIAVGTSASYPIDISENGSVIIGTKTFMHNGHHNGSNPCSNWQEAPFDKVIDSKNLSKDDFKAIIRMSKFSDIANDYFLVSPLNPASSRTKFERASVMANYDYVALGTVNVTDYSEYAQKDDETLNAYLKNVKDDNGRSIETTHGLIHAAAKGSPFLFISGIVDRVGKFKQDIEPCVYGQNFVGAHNAGVVVAYMLVLLDEYCGQPCLKS